MTHVTDIHIYDSYVSVGMITDPWNIDITEWTVPVHVLYLWYKTHVYICTVFNNSTVPPQYWVDTLLLNSSCNRSVLFAESCTSKSHLRYTKIIVELHNWYTNTNIRFTGTVIHISLFPQYFFIYINTEYIALYYNTIDIFNTHENWWEYINR